MSRYPLDLYKRYIPSVGGFQTETLSVIASIGRVYYMPIIIKSKVVIDRLGCMHGTVGAGHFYLAIYNSVNEAPTDRIAVSEDTVANGANQKQQVNITPETLALATGVYYIGLEADNTTDIYWQVEPGLGVVGIRQPENTLNGPSFYVEDLGAYGEPPQMATPIYAGPGWIVGRSYLVWARVVPS